MRSWVRRTAFLVAAATAGACAAILGIEDRVLMEEPGLADGGEAGEAAPPVDANGDDAGDDAPFVISVIPDASCDDATCAAIDGAACVEGACQIACGAGCVGATIACPPDTDCQVVCAKNGCNDAKCTGGRSCTFECATTNCVRAACESERCSFRCGPAACGNAACDAAVSCAVDCQGASSCDVAGGIAARAGESCSISCTGQSTCGGGGGGGENSPIRCDAPDSSITCGAAKDTCKDGIPTCNGDLCTVNCLGTDSCEDGYCCDAGQCVKNGSRGAKLCN